MNYTTKELDELLLASHERLESLIQEYRRTHKVPSRGIISTPEIDAERAEQKRLYGEYCKLRESKTDLNENGNL